MSMRIAVVTESFLPQVNGVTNSVLRVLEFLENQGHEALVIAPESEGMPSEYRGYPVKSIPAIPLQALLPIGMPVALPSRKLQHLIEDFQPDVIHLASPFALGAYAARVAKKMGVPSVSIYQTDLAGFASHYGLNVAHNSLRKVVGKIHSNTTRTLAPSTSACSDLRSMGVPSVHLWRRGVNSLLFEPAKRNEELRNNWGAPKKLIVGYVGRLANEKRISDLVGLSMDPTISLVIVGDGPAREKLERELPNAIFTGFRSGDDLASAYASFDLFIHPGPNETFCQTVQEALASGTPCIVPTTGGPSDLVTSGATGYIIPTDNPAVLSATVEHFRSRTDRQEMRETARNSVATRTWSSVNRQLLKHYQEVIAEQRSATNVPSHNGHDGHDGHEGKESAGNEGAVA